MKLTVTRPPGTDLVHILLEVPATADPERCADIAWTAVDRVLTELRTTGDVPDA